MIKINKAELLETLNKIRLSQLKLDSIIQSKKGNGSTEYLILALFAEFGEMLNEWNLFKFWHSNPVVNEDAWKEESIDILHIAMTLLNELTLSDYLKPIEQAIDLAFEVDYEEALLLKTTTPGDTSNLVSWIAIAILPFKEDWAELETAYYKKHNKNIERANNINY